MGDSDKWSVSRVYSKIKISTNVCMFAFNDFDMILLRERRNVGVLSGSCNDNLTGVSLVYDGFNAFF